ncbi:MAG: sigma-70 family RNA polymerase sigma factor [Thermoanaerobaculia bacterium]
MKRPPRAKTEQRPGTAYEAVFSERLGLLRQLTERICQHHRFDVDAAADFSSWALLRIMDNDYAILRAHSGKCRMATYLRIVVRNLFRDFRNHLWGKWRPSACARHLGTLAVELERLLHRDGFEVEEAIRILSNRLGRWTSREELEALAERLPRRPVRRQEPFQEEQFSAGASPLRLLEDRDSRRAWAHTGNALQRAFAELSAEDRRILKLYFAQGLTMAAIARQLRLNQRSLYTRRDRCLGRLRRTLEGEGLGWRDVRPLLGQDTGTAVFEQIAC